MIGFNDASVFAGLVESRRGWYHQWCPTCGLSFGRWEGCQDSFHIGRPDALHTNNRSGNVTVHTDDPGTLATAHRGRAETPVKEASPHE